MASEHKSDFWGVVEKESLKRPEYLSTFIPKLIVKEKHPDSEEPLWHVYLLKTRAKKIKSITQRFSAITKPGWYSVFWNDQNTYVVIEHMVISIPTEKDWRSQDYHNMQKMVEQNGIQPEYLDFNKNFEEYRKLIDKAGD